MRSGIILFLFLSFLNPSTFAESVSIPLSGVKKPSSDLLDAAGQSIEVGKAAQMAEGGVDLSQFNPLDNEIWQNKSYSANDSGERSYPTSQVGVKWVYAEASYAESYMSMYMGRVSSLSDGKLYRLTLSRATHAALLRAALLRKLGYFIPSPKFYRDLKLVFESEEQKNTFLNNAQTEMGTDFESRHWISKDDKSEHSLILASAVLEPASADYFDIAWGFAPPAQDPNQYAKLQRLSRYRAFRGLVLPYVLADIPESVNRFSPKAGSVLSNQVVLSHPFADSFQAIAIDDARWMMRRLLALKESELKEIVNESKAPAQLIDLIYAKLVYRIQNLSELFGMKSQFQIVLPNLKINSADGIVKDGKVTVELIEGYPQRFAHGDRQSPYSNGDLGRYLKIDGLSSILGSLITQLNQRLELLSVSDAAMAHQKEVIHNIIDHYKKNPFVPYSQQIDAWGAPLASLNMKSARHIATGTYFNSTASLQLVDNISVGGNLGYFVGFDGVKNAMPNAGLNLNVVRDYTHVRPIHSIQEGSKESWKNLFIPGVMLSAAKLLANTEPVAGEKPEDPKQHPLDKFLRDLREGEVFLITDSVMVGAYAQVSSPLDVLMGIAPLSFMNSITVGVDASRVILGQTLITRTRDGIQVYIRKQNASVLGAQFDLNFFVNVMSIRAQTTQMQGHTDAFVVDYDPEYVANLDLKDPKNAKYIQTRDGLQSALRALLKGNDSELLYGKFHDRQFEVDHEMKTKETRVKFMLSKMKGYSEAQLVELTPPMPANRPDLKPEDYKVSLYGYKKGQLVGMDLLGLGVDLVNGLLSQNKTQLNWSGSQDPNPANTPYGKAFWRIVDTQKDISTKPGKYQSSAFIQHVWGGWSIKRDKFFKLIDEIENDLGISGITAYRLIEKENFMNMQSLDFYRVTAQASLMETGIQKLRELILQPDADGKTVAKVGFLARIFQKLSGGPARANDKEMYTDMMTLLGGGNYQAGLVAYTQSCQEYNRNQHGGESSAGDSTSAWYKGSNYECLIPWMQNLIKLSREYPATDKKAQTKWATEVLWVLDQNIPLPMLLKYLGQENYIFFVRVNGFRKGDEDGDLEFFSNSVGNPSTSFEYSNGLMNYWASKSRILPVEIDRSQGGF